MINPRIEINEKGEEEIIKKRNYIGFCKNLERNIENENVVDVNDVNENNSKTKYISFPDYSILSSLISDSLLGNSFNSFITFINSKNIDLCIKLLTVSSFLKRIKVFIIISNYLFI